ncbi:MULTISPECIES: PTS sugar transporter subunit IIA [Brevibacillus]|uniref:PTS sugar transporter subunit IIA n=1 Tax=Brevibacillus TaxID=55080 RepID=UPI000E2F96C7|nr:MULTISPECIES: PTS sugar transporter subunit IIA [Brevibacillus]MBG9771807.1 PTS sugar transporter subunit IIA [Brevibacillus laterosporus]MCG7318210.1 PTS sugar transporter subunit IIA [Brevibacillus laterosporus]MED1790600.1 PTS sugar transporter subunit IIA [Brevibacillus laterosporus]RFB38263.1 PTS sugar transporter subunit IIA [Brevibacillus sp. VP]
MLSELLTRDHIQVIEEIPTWEEAIRLAAQPLLDDGSIQDTYIQAMIHNVRELGPYIVIAPDIAIPHSRPENGVNKVGMSFLKCHKPVSFSEKAEHQVRLFFVLAATDNDSHLGALSQLTEVLSDPNSLQTLLTTDSIEEVFQLIQVKNNQ